MARKARKKNIKKMRRAGNFNIGVVIFFIIIIYVGFNIYSYFTTTHISEYLVQQGTIASNYVYQGVIVRDETVEYAPMDGFINYYMKNASKVSVTDVIYSIDTTGAISKKIAQSILTSDALSSDALTSISSKIDTFVNDYDSNRFSESYTFFNSLSTEITQDMNSTALASLSSQVASAEGNQTFHKMTSPKDGVIVYEIDGFEQYSIEDILSSDISYSNYQKQNLFANEEVTSGSPVYKRVNSEYWNVIVEINEELAKELSEKNAVRVRFCKDDFELDTACSLLKKNDTYYLNLSLNKGMIRYIDDRFIDIELVMNDKIGLKIPKSAIATKEFFTIPKNFFASNSESSSLHLLTKKIIDGTESTVEISPTLYYETEDYYYVDNEDISENTVIVMPDGSATYTVGTNKDSLIGVYNINKGYAVFKQINIIYENEAYAIVETKTAYGISLYDHIALDSSTIEENQLTTK